MNFPRLSRGVRLMEARLQNRSGEEIGKVVEWLMDVEKGCVIYVVAEFFNAPGYYPIPWALLRADLETGAFEVDQHLVQKPEYYLNYHDLNESIEDWELTEKIFSRFSLPVHRSAEPPAKHHVTPDPLVKELRENVGVPSRELTFFQFKGAPAPEDLGKTG